jgi:hypothetical protein
MTAEHRATRKWLIDAGRRVAVELIREHGRTNARELHAEMARRDLLDVDVANNHWIGAVFNKRGLFQWSGEWFTPRVETAAALFNDGRPIKVWQQAV